MQPDWLVLIPPFLVLFCAFYTKRIVTSLLVGIFAAAFIAAQFAPLETIKLVLESIKNQASDLDNIYTFGFLILLGIVLGIVTKTGGALALGNIITSLKTQKVRKLHLYYFLQF